MTMQASQKMRKKRKINMTKPITQKEAVRIWTTNIEAAHLVRYWTSLEGDYKRKDILLNKVMKQLGILEVEIERKEKPKPGLNQRLKKMFG